tara:strand:- start:972 stop:1091 length:120 start_codon:yes stop_codon:yes gene_type:complete
MAGSKDYLLLDEKFSNVFLIYNEALFVKEDQIYGPYSKK